MIPSLRTSIKKSRIAWIAIGICIVAAMGFIAATTKTGGYLKLVPYHSNGLDIFFTCFTYLGDGIFILLLAVVLLVRKNKWLGITIIVSYALSGLLAQLAKYLYPAPRPAVFFRELGTPFYEIPGVTLMNSMASFPSGHTTSAFALLGTLILFYPKSPWNGLWIILAIAVGYSRIYLGNHFLADVTGGSILGLVAAFGTVAMLKKFSKSKAT